MQACTGEATDFGQRILSRLAARPPLPPYRLKVWPDGTSIVPGSLRSRRARPAGGGKPARSLPAQAPRPQAAGLSGQASRGSKRPAAARDLFAAFEPPRGAGTGPGVEQVSPAAARLAALRARIRAKEAANLAGASSQQP